MERPVDLDALAMEFFREFARSEYCLKAVGLRREGPDAKASWLSYANQVMQVFEAGQSDELRAAVNYFLEAPRKSRSYETGF